MTVPEPLCLQHKCGCCCGEQEQQGLLCAGYSLGIPRKALTVLLSLQPSSHLHRRLGPGPGRTSGITDHQLRPAQQQRALHPQVSWAFPWGWGTPPPHSHTVTPSPVPFSRGRIGRSGRYGRKGVAINFVKNDDIRILRDIEQYYSTQIDEMPMNGECCCCCSPSWGQPALLGCPTHTLHTFNSCFFSPSSG